MLITTQKAKDIAEQTHDQDKDSKVGGDKKKEKKIQLGSYRFSS